MNITINKVPMQEGIAKLICIKPKPAYSENYEWSQLGSVYTRIFIAKYSKIWLSQILMQLFIIPGL